jgi:hypothetical protein
MDKLRQRKGGAEYFQGREDIGGGEGIVIHRVSWPYLYW